MSHPSTLIGFDVRLHPRRFVAQRWDRISRERYLLVPTTPYPLSVDPMIWPSRFSLSPGEAPDPNGSVIALVPSDTTRYFQLFDLWDDLREMLAHYRPAQGGDAGLAVGLVKPEHYRPGFSHAADEWWKAIYQGAPIYPEQPEAHWRLLGYDIANSGYSSALCNFVFCPADKTALQTRWAGALNRYGLFQSLDPASEYCAHMDTLLHDHSPFFVFELWLLWSTLHPPGKPENTA